MSFKPGISGNPAGRPRGTGDPGRLIETMIRPHLMTLIERTLAAALKGDPQASTALLSLYSTIRRDSPPSR